MHWQMRVRLAMLVIFNVLATTKASHITFSCPTGWDMIGTHCYHFVNIPMDFEDARDVCDTYGAKLLYIRDEIEAKNVASVAVEKFTPHESFWIYNGKSGTPPETGILNSTFCTGMWQPNEPRETDDKVAVASNMQGRWALTWVWSNLPFVCRAPACPTGTFRCSDGTCINSKWKCDTVYDCLDLSDENNCLDGTKYYSISSGSVDTSILATNDFYQWIIEGQLGEVLKIQFEMLTIQDHSDSVKVYTGGPSIMTSDLIVDIRESQTERLSFFSRNHFIIVTVQTYAGRTKPLIKFNWKPDSEASWKQVTEINIKDSVTSIFSPYFNSISDPVSYKREWHVTAPNGELITLEVLNDTLELNASSDFYIVTNVGFAFQELKSQKAIYISNTNSMSVIIKSRSLKKYLSFHAILRKGCDFVTNVSLATFTLKNLPANHQCNWKVQNKLATDFMLRIEETVTMDSKAALQIYQGIDGHLNMIDVLNQSTAGLKEYISLYGDVTFFYVPDIFRSGIEFQGKISANCSYIQTSNMTVNIKKANTAGEAYTAEISCLKGFNFKQEEYSKQGTMSAVCNEGGIWNWGSPSFTRSPECQDVYCGFPPPIPHGYVLSINGNITYNNAASYQCFSGFSITGSPDITCQADGSWSTLPSCVAEKCSKVQVVVNGNSDTNDVSEGSVVTFNCDPGYSLQGPMTIACLSNKTWSHHQPVCKKSTCPLPAIEHGYYVYTSLPLFGESVTLVCDRGYQINRTKSHSDSSNTCSVNRTLREKDTCVDIDECIYFNMCPTNAICINLNGSHSCVCKSGYNGTYCKDVDECALNTCHQKCTNSDGSYSCSCYEGYTLYTKNGTNSFYIPAGEDGQKHGDVFEINHTCVPATCSKKPPPPVQGKVLITRQTYFYNETAKVICNFGYALENPSYAICGSDGNWTYSTNPICKQLTCPSPTSGDHEASRVPATQHIEPGATLTITCTLNDGSGNTMNKTLFCAPSPDDYGKFVLQGDDPTCPVVNCGQPLDIPGWNSIYILDTTFGNSFEFTCDSSRKFTRTGNSTLGNTTVVCQSNGRWGYGTLTCEGSSCQDPGTLAGTTQIVKTSYEIDQVVQYNCTKPGFTTVSNDTLVCEYKNGNLTWSDSPPSCQDTEPPSIACPSLGPVDLYSTLVYPDPKVTDNSGITCFIIESGPPSGVSIVSHNMTVRFRATDTRNNAFCSLNITVKDRTEPAIQCQPAIKVDLKDSKYELYNLTEALLVTHSGDGTIMIDPIGPLNLTLGSVFPVRVKITKENGLFKGCAVLISAVSTICTNNSLLPPDNGRIHQCTSNGNQMTCEFICDKGYLFDNSSNSKNYSCINGEWEMALPLQPCLKMSYPTYSFDVDLQYSMNGLKFPPSPHYNAGRCLQQQYNCISQLVEDMSACGFNNFIAINLHIIREIDIQTDEIAFTLQLLSPDGNETRIKGCNDTLQSQSVNLFGPTSPVIDTTLSCFAPWHVVANTAHIVPKTFSCSNNLKLIDYHGVSYCLPCGPGTFFNKATDSCQECQDGFYQDEEGRTECKQCPQGVLRSNKPRSNKRHCLELCPEGFISTSGYVKDNCSPCPENHFSKSANFCQPCPNNGSTLGLSGAISENQCSDPCSPGEYSITGYKPCSVCPENFYSSNQGAKRCQECPSDTFTTLNRLTSRADCNNGSSLCTANFCNASGTVNNQTCEIRDHRAMCQCKPGFYGDSCNKSCDVCNPNPCYNGGVCTASGLNFTCACKEDSSCEFVLNKTLMFTTNDTFVTVKPIRDKECQESCLKNINCLAYLMVQTLCLQYETLLWDTATNIFDPYVKICNEKMYFDGPLCERDMINDCNSTVCASSDFCMDLVEDTKCQCPHGGNYDSKCEKIGNPCQGNNCSLHGRCIPYGSVRAVCECDPGYTGDSCETNINECNINSHGCLYSGTCLDESNTYSCSCQDGFSGRHCEVQADFCSNSNCRVTDGGICINDYHNFTAICVCGEGYISDPTSASICIPISYCSSNPCKNGICNEVAGGFRCDCHLGFEGFFCQHNINDCINNKCENGASCIDGVSTYTCTCPTGFTGLFCDTNINECVGHCVVNHTLQCLDLIGDYYCSCTPAYKGKNCSEPVDLCTAYEPCLHGGNCSNFTGGYHCKCPVGWTGQNCEKQVDYCSVALCQNNAMCYNLIDQNYCKCQDGTEGIHCEHAKQLCDTFNDMACSSNGKCKLSGGTIQCQCLEDYSGKACELEKNYCADNPCHGGFCTQHQLTYDCDCTNVTNYHGKNCNETNMICSTTSCPQNAKCQEFQDQNGYQKIACLCKANEVLIGDTCITVDRDYDLAFLEGFTKKRTYLTSENGFYLGNNSDLSITMWVAAAEKLNNTNFILALRSSKMSEPFLTIFNTEVHFTSQDYITFVDDIGRKHSLDESFLWHFFSIVWLRNGSVQIMWDFLTLNTSKASANLPSEEFVFLQLGQQFYGYISQVSVWGTALTPLDHYNIYNNKLAVPQQDKLLLGWTQYSFDSSVKIITKSTADASFSICDIPKTIARGGPNRPECKMIVDKTPPEIINCESQKMLLTDYSKHQVSSSNFGYEFTDETDGQLFPERQFFSYGAYDIAVSLKDSTENIGVCMTRTYVTPNKCSDTEPTGGYLTQCPDNPAGKHVICPPNMFPSVPTPNFISCSNLLTYNLDDLYERPDRIVCGLRTPKVVTLNILLPYRISADCDDRVVASINEHIRLKMKAIDEIWKGFCSDTNCSNVDITGNCTDLSSMVAFIKISGINESLSSSSHQTMRSLEIMNNYVANKTFFELAAVAIAHHENMTYIDETPSCKQGHSLLGNDCVQCGAGSYYDEEEAKCKLCELDTYSEIPGSDSCTPCPGDKVTLQRGSTNTADCKEKCQAGQMLNITSDECVHCARNFYQNLTGKSYCFPCPPASVTKNNGSTSQADCIAVCNPGTEFKGQGCVDCPRGFYRTGDSDDLCSPCSQSNFTTKGTGSISEDECNIPKCHPGSFAQERYGTFTCQFCDFGTYQPNEAALECLPCGESCTTENRGETDVSSCICD